MRTVQTKKFAAMLLLITVLCIAGMIFRSPSAPSLFPSASVLLSQRQTVPPVKESKLVAFYYAWYHKSTDPHQGWSRHGHNEDPLLGFYESNDRRVIEQHIDWAVAYGIDAFCISTIESPEKVLAARNIDKIKIIPLVEYWSVFEPPHIQDLSARPNQEKLKDYLKKLIPVLTHPSAMKIDGKVVVYFYLTRLMRNFPESAKAFITEGLPVEIFWVADQAYTYGGEVNPEYDPLGLKGRSTPMFDSYTAYNMYWNSYLVNKYWERNNGMKLIDYTKKVMMPIFESWANKTRFFPHVMSRYRDFRPENAPIWGTPENFREVLRITRKLSRGPNPHGEHMVFLTTWNEWWEGTSLEPSEQWGFEFLEVLRQEMKPHLPKPDFAVSQYREPKDKASAWWLEYRDFMAEQYAGRAPTVYPQPFHGIEEKYWKS